MRVLLVHNRYQQRGGEDVVVENETALLQSKGHTVRLVAADNNDIGALKSKFSTALGSIFSTDSRELVSNEIRSFCPDIVHVHNTFPLLSPSVYYACADAGVPVVQTLHNFRLICPSAILSRERQICEDCVRKRFAWNGILHKCYRGSVAGSGVLATMIAVHRLLGTWKERVSAYIALTQFAMQKFVEGGLPKDKLFVKPNFVFPQPERGKRSGNYALFVGRLAPEKGIETLLRAWKTLPQDRVLKVVGDGPLSKEVLSACEQQRNIECLGRQPKAAVHDLMDSAAFLVFPSEWYEGFPVVIAEAFAKGLPVVASNLGSAAELVSHGKTGLLFPTGDATELAKAAQWAFTNGSEMAHMSDAARAEFESKYTADHNYSQLMQIYSAVMKG
jgi:glycosyltransferase involved in cell wall biosynthesis